MHCLSKCEGIILYDLIIYLRQFVITFPKLSESCESLNISGNWMDINLSFFMSSFNDFSSNHTAADILDSITETSCW